MVFVYRGAGKKLNDASGLNEGQKDPRCRKLACDIQWCLSRNNYKESRCADFIARWEDCTEKVNAKLRAEKKSAQAQQKKRIDK